MPAAKSSKSPIAFRLAVIAAAVGIVFFAVEGGEWGTLDLMSQKRRTAVLERNLDSLQHVVDSLRRYRKRIDTDPALQERIAREEFGMVRGNKELLYRFTEPAQPANR